MNETGASESFVPMNIVMWDQLNTCEFLYTGIMTRDLGPWKCGESVELVFNFDDGTVKQFNDDGKVVQEAKLKLEVV